MIISLILAAALALSPVAATAPDVEIPETVAEETAPMWELTLERHEARRRAGYKPEQKAVAMEYLGRYWITGYDACKACCGKTDGITASGVKAQVGRTCAAPKGFAFGTRLYIDGLGERVVEDRGGAIKGSKIDVFCTEYIICQRKTSHQWCGGCRRSKRPPKRGTGGLIMADYIDREAAIDAMCRVCVVEKDRQSCAYAKGKYGGCDVMDGIKQVPAADVVEVVRCGECANVFRSEAPALWCEGRGWPMQMVPPDGFCDKGKRKEAESGHN